MEASCSRFTPAEGGTRLALAAWESNILAVEYGSFIATRLIHEDAYKIRGSLHDGRQRSVYMTRSSRVACISHELNIMTDLAVAQATDYAEVYDWREWLDSKEVLVCTSSVLRRVLDEGMMEMPNINVLIIDSCHLIWIDEDMQHIMKLYKQCDEDKKPRILALTHPIFASNKNSEENVSNDKSKDCNEATTENEKCVMDSECKAENDGTEEEIDSDKRKTCANTIGAYENQDDYDMYEKLEWKIEELEEKLCCQMDLAEDIDGGKSRDSIYRLSALVGKPKELIIEYDAQKPMDELSEDYLELDRYMRQTISDAIEFLDDHRYDPTEIYGDELYEEFKNIPDPTIEPKEIFSQFIYVLDQLGPYAADKAAFSLLIKLEKLKIKVPYERHFLIFCLCTTIFVKIRCFADSIFAKYESDWQKMKEFCSPKIVRLAEILQTFQPPEQQRTKTEMTAKMMGDLEKCDFTTLANKIEDQVNTLKMNLNDIDTAKVTDDVNGVITNEINNSDLKRTSVTMEAQKSEVNNTKSGDVSDNVISDNKLGFTRRSGGRVRGRGRNQRFNATRIQQMMQNPDALCGIVFVKEALAAKILFMLIAV
ncbi:hypothetical protein ACJJTC_008668 [Scirpophaga incertulas]